MGNVLCPFLMAAGGLCSRHPILGSWCPVCLYPLAPHTPLRSWCLVPCPNLVTVTCVLNPAPLPDHVSLPDVCYLLFSIWHNLVHLGGHTQTLFQVPLSPLRDIMGTENNGERGWKHNQPLHISSVMALAPLVPPFLPPLAHSHTSVSQD